MRQPGNSPRNRPLSLKQNRITENGDAFLSKITWKGGALLAPLPPALVSCGTMERPNVLTIAWTGIINTLPPKTYISVRPSRFSYSLIRDSGEFVVNLTTAGLVRAADFCGVKSGRNMDKFAAAGLDAEEATSVSCPMIRQSPVSLECRVTDVMPMGSHDMFIADIVAVNVAEEYVDSAGKLHLDRCALAAYAHGEYFELGRKIGSFGFSVRKKNRKKRTGGTPKQK